MKIVILTSGPRGTGKSTYSKLIKEAHPDIKYLSRDELLIDSFGVTALDSYSGGYEYIDRLFTKQLKEILAEDSDIKIIADYWNGYSSGRRALIKNFKECGADLVYCFKFIIPKEICLNWFFKKPDSRGYSERGISNDYNLYYRTSENIEDDGFDAIYYINPLQLTIPGFPLI